MQGSFFYKNKEVLLISGEYFSKNELKSRLHEMEVDFNNNEVYLAVGLRLHFPFFACKFSRNWLMRKPFRRFSSFRATCSFLFATCAFSRNHTCFSSFRHAVFRHWKVKKWFFNVFLRSCARRHMKKLYICMILA